MKSVGEVAHVQSGIDRRIYLLQLLWNEDIRQGRTKEVIFTELEDMGSLDCY